MKKIFISFLFFFFLATAGNAQFNFGPPVPKKLDPVIQKMVDEEMNNSQLKVLAHELMDKIGPRLVGTPKMQQAHDWAVAKYKSWGVEARNEKWGEWRGWERGVSHIDMIAPWVKTLAGTQLAWCPSTKGKTITADVIILPDLADSAAFAAWMPNVKGKFVMISMMQPTGRPDADWEKYGTEKSREKMNKERDSLTRAWAKRVSKTGYNTRTLPVALEKAGAAGILTSYWSKEYGADKIFSAYTKAIPTVDISLEDYGLVYRLAEDGSNVKMNIRTDSRETGVQPTFNTVGEIKGTEKPNEYVLLSAHFDSWDGGTGATDNGTGTLTMMEAMRLLKLYYPNPKRTILVGHWGSEEQGLNGSRAFAEDHPEIVKGLQASFNQDNGTGRIENVSGQGFLNAYEYIQRWLYEAPLESKKDIKTTFPGSPSGGGSDNASFVAVGAPGFSLGSLSWGYFSNTWHTNLDTYDKIVFDDVEQNAILAAALAYMASEDPSFFNREKSVLPPNPFNGQPGKWPAVQPPTRRGGLD
ncbi:MAG: M20/M25/M40 family metallo-hydrolase [Chitinophagales bacterium]|nr:M20/M25/M40 family metallo-hydrolase [Chitinophagales bacterium]